MTSIMEGMNTTGTVPKAGFEPALLAEADFKSAVSTISPPGRIIEMFRSRSNYQISNLKGKRQ